jgi:hypothetical protein
VARDVVFGWDGENRIPLNQVMQPVDIQGISMSDSSESLPVRLVDINGNPVDPGGSGASAAAIEITTIVNGDQLRTITEKTIALPSLLKYTRYQIQVFNGSDADIKIAPWNTNVAVLDDGSYGGFGTGTTEDTFAWVVPKKNAINNGVFYLNDMDPKQNGATSTKKVKDAAKLFENRFNTDGAYTLAYKAVTAPTTNGVTIKVIGWLK